MSEDAPVTDAAPAAEAPASEAPAAEESIDLDGELTGDTFDRGYVEKVRREAAKHRTSAKELQQKYESLFEGFDDPADVQYLVDLARNTLNDPSATLKDWERVYNNIREMAGAGEPDALPEDSDEDRPLTRADLERIERERAVDAAQRQIQKEAEELGYSDPQSHQYRSLMWIAANDREVAGDIQKAHAKLEAEREALRQEGVAAYLKQIEENADAFPPVAGGSAGAGGPAGGTQGGPPKDWKSARASAEARIAAMQRGS